MTSPFDMALAHRLLLAHLQAATSIATTFQNLPSFTPHPSDILPNPTLFAPQQSHNRPPPPPPITTPRRSRSPPPTAGKLHTRCKPEPSPSPSYTPTSPHQQSPTRHPPTTHSPPTPPPDPSKRLLPLPAATFSLHSSSTTPPPPPPPSPRQTIPAPTPSPPYPDNGGWEPSDDEKLASLKLNKRARPSWKQIAKTLNKTPFDCKTRWKTLQLLYTPQPLDNTDTKSPAAALIEPPATRDASTMTSQDIAPLNERTGTGNAADFHDTS